MARLEQARLRDAWTALRVHPPRFALACYLAELVDRLAPEAAAAREARELFAAVLGALRLVASRDPDPRLRALIELRVLAALGLRPELRRCVRCTRDVGASADRLRAAPTLLFHVGEGGPVCPACTRAGESGAVLHRGTVRAREQGLELPMDRCWRASCASTSASS
jgi:recombinational DNA repair protein (RecF pathway)